MKNCPVLADLPTRTIECAECKKREMHKGTDREAFYEKVTEFRENCPIQPE